MPKRKKEAENSLSGWSDVIRASGEQHRQKREQYPQHAKLSDVASAWKMVQNFLVWVRDNPDKAPLLEALTDTEIRDVIAAYLEVDLEAYAREEEAMASKAKD
jgi:hypothetical protein